MDFDNNTPTETTTTENMSSESLDGDLQQTPSSKSNASVADDIRDAVNELGGDEKDFFEAPKKEAKESDLKTDETQGQEADAKEKGDSKEDIELPPIDYPLSWHRDSKSDFEKLPRPLQELIVKREKEREGYLTKRTQEIAGLEKHFKGIDEALTPYKQKLNLAGLTEGQAVKQLLAAQDMLDRDPVNGLKWLAQNYGVNLNHILQNQQPIDPRFQAVSQELESLKQTLNNQTMQQEQVVISSLEKEIEHFANETDSNGQSKRPHFNDIMNDMVLFAAQLRSSQPHLSAREILNEAYDKAVYANPRVRERVIEREFKLKEEKRAQEAKKKAEAARKANISLTGAPAGVGNQVVKGDDLRGAILQAMDGRI